MSKPPVLKRLNYSIFFQLFLSSFSEQVTKLAAAEAILVWHICIFICMRSEINK